MGLRNWAPLPCGRHVVVVVAERERVGVRVVVVGDIPSKRSTHDHGPTTTTTDDHDHGSTTTTRTRFAHAHATDHRRPSAQSRATHLGITTRARRSARCAPSVRCAAALRLLED